MQAVGSGRLVAGRYRLNSPIGRGAMGIVWRGRDELLDRDVAVKQVQITSLATPAEAEIIYRRTLREARTAARLSHPSVVTVFDVVEENGSPWIVMELVRARSLDQVIAEDGPLPPLEAAIVGETLLSALATAHAAGVLHRDVKPSNVLITSDGRAVLTDFGIATFEGDPGLTQVGMVVGTPGFTAPERIRSKPASPASDLWSLGATLYAAVEGRGPFDRPGGSMVIMAGVINEDAPRAPSAGPLGPAIDALLRRDPAARPDSDTAARLLADAISQAKTGPRPLGDAWPDLTAAGALPAAASDATTALHAASGPARGATGSRDGGAASGPVGAGGGGAGGGGGAAGAGGGGGAGGAGGAAARGGAAGGGAAGAGGGGAVAGAGVPAFMETPAFADLKMPDQDTSADLPGQIGPPPSAELPAFMDAPRFADPPALPPDLAVPWSLANAPASWDPQDPLSLPDSHGSGAATVIGSPAPPRRPGRRGRALAAAAGVAVLAVAGIISWSAYSHSHASTSAFAQSPSQPTAGPTVSAHPAHHARAARRGTGHKSTSTGAAGADTTTTTSKSHRAADSPKPRSTATKATATPSPTATGGSTGPGTGGTGGGTPPPAGYKWYQVSAASLGTTAGFKIAVPDAWQMRRTGLQTYLDAPTGSVYIEIDETPFAYAGPVREAEYLQAQAKADRTYHSYQLLAIKLAYFRGVREGSWRFHWQQLGLGRVGVLELLFTLNTSAGPQSYALTVSAPAANFVAADLIFHKSLQTFKPLP